MQELSLASNDLKAVPSHALDVFREFASLKHFDLSYNSISDNITNDTVSGISASLSSLKLSMKKTLLVSSLTWVNKLQELNYLLLESTETFPSLDASRYQLFSLQKLDIIHFYVYFSPCFAFPNLKSLTMVDTFIYNFPADLALRECYNLRVLSLSHFESDINTFDDEHLNITIPFLHTLTITENKVTSIKPILSIKAPKLATLEISSNLIKTIDIEIGQVFPNLIHLNIADNAIVSLSGLKHCKFLEYLNAAGNHITAVPLVLLSSLKILDLRPKKKLFDWRNIGKKIG